MRVQAILLAWALGALLEGLVGFGYPWAVIAPILVGLGVVEIDAIRVAAIGNNAPVSFGALGAPIIALAAVTSVPLPGLSASVGRIVAILALLPPWILIYLVTGRRGLRGIWPLPVVGSLAYIVGQFPTSQWLGPYLPDVIGALVSLRRAAAAAEVLAACRDPRLRRRPDHRGSRARGRHGGWHQGGWHRVGGQRACWHRTCCAGGRAAGRRRA